MSTVIIVFFLQIICSIYSGSGRSGSSMSGNFTCSDSLLTECMPQLTSLFPTSVQYDCSVVSPVHVRNILLIRPRMQYMKKIYCTGFRLKE